MFVTVVHKNSQVFYMNGDCSARTIREYLKKKCSSALTTKMVDLIDTDGKLLYLSWMSDITNVKRLFKERTLYILVVLRALPEDDALKIVPMLDNWQKLYPDVVNNVQKPILLKAAASPPAVPPPTPPPPSAAAAKAKIKGSAATSLLTRLKIGQDPEKKDEIILSAFFKNVKFKKIRPQEKK